MFPTEMHKNIYSKLFTISQTIVDQFSFRPQSFLRHTNLTVALKYMFSLWSHRPDHFSTHPALATNPHQSISDGIEMITGHAHFFVVDPLYARLSYLHSFQDSCVVETCKSLDYVLVDILNVYSPIHQFDGFMQW